MSILYGDAFIPTSEVIRLIIPGVVFGGACATLLSYFNGTGRATLIPKLMFGPVVFQLVVTVAVVERYGVECAAAAISIGQCLYGLLIIFWFCRESRVSVGALVPTKGDVSILFHQANINAQKYFGYHCEAG